MSSIARASAQKYGWTMRPTLKPPLCGRGSARASARRRSYSPPEPTICLAKASSPSAASSSRQIRSAQETSKATFSVRSHRPELPCAFIGVGPAALSNDFFRRSRDCGKVLPLQWHQFVFSAALSSLLSLYLSRDLHARHLFCPSLPLSLLLPRGLSRCPMVDRLLLKGKKESVSATGYTATGARAHLSHGPFVAGNDTWSVDIARGRGGGEGSAVRSASGARGRTRQRREHRNIGRIWHGSSPDFFSPVLRCGINVACAPSAEGRVLFLKVQPVSRVP